MFSNMSVEKITEIAQQTRYDFDHRNISADEIADYLHVYAPRVIRALAVATGLSLQSPVFREFIVSQCQQSINNFPREACVDASVVLRARLGDGCVIERGGYHIGDSEIAPHSFVAVNGGKDIVDITADQFKGPEVYVGRFKLPWDTEPPIV